MLQPTRTRDSLRELTATGASAWATAFPRCIDWLRQQELVDAQVDLALDGVHERLQRRQADRRARRRILARQIRAHQRDLLRRFRSAAAARVRRAHDDVPDRAALRRVAPAVDSPAAHRNAPQGRDACRSCETTPTNGRRFRSTCRTPAKMSEALAQSVGSRSACRWRSRGRSACRRTTTRHRADRLPAAATTASTCRAGDTRSSTFLIRCCSRASSSSTRPGSTRPARSPSSRSTCCRTRTSSCSSSPPTRASPRPTSRCGGAISPGDDPAQKAARIVALNKIDSLWDGLRPESAVAAEIGRQVAASATHARAPGRAGLSGVRPEGRSSPRSNGDDALLERSRLPALEAALAAEAHPRQARHRGRDHALRGERALAPRRAAMPRGAAVEHRRAARGSARAARQESGRRRAHDGPRAPRRRTLFERGVQRFTALRTVFTQQTSELFDVIGLEALRANAGRTRRGIERSPFTRACAAR